MKEKRSKTVRRILDAAKDVFSEVGFAGARVDEIAKRARVNKASIYYHIGEKDALYAEVLHDVFGRTGERMAGNMKEENPPEERLKAYIQNIARTLDQHPHVPPIIMREVASGGKNFPEVVMKDIARIVSMLAEILEEGAEKGIFVETNPLVVHLMVLGAFIFYKNLESIRAKHPAFPETLRKLDKNTSRSVAEEIEKLLLGAVHP